MSMEKAIGLTPTYGGTSRKYVLPADTSTASIAFTEDGYCLVLVDALTFVRTGAPGSTPTALSDGTDQVLAANIPYRIGPMLAGQKLAFRSIPGGNAYVTPSV